MNKKIVTLIVLIITYFLLKYYIPYWNYIIYPINLIVTFLHEFWHAFWTLITWWSVESITINTDWSWLTWSRWWWMSIILLWWYVWSAIFWNILLYIWFTSDKNNIKKYKLSEKIIYFLAWLMIFTSIFWYETLLSSIILLVIALIFIILVKKINFDALILQFLWVTSILFILEDFSVWPSSDLAKFSDIFVIVPQIVWMYIWLIIVIVITWINLKFIFKK